MKLKEMHIRGYKSIDGQRGQTISLGDLTILLGANGACKSNLVSFFLNSCKTGWSVTASLSYGRRTCWEVSRDSFAWTGCCGRIYELGGRQFSVPGVETPGYFRQSLWDAVSRISPPWRGDR